MPYIVVMGVGIIHGHRKNNVYGASGIGKIVMNAKAVMMNEWWKLRLQILRGG